MPKHTIETIELPDGYSISVRWWRPEASKGAVLYFHGIQSHGGWYERSGEALAEEGFTVLMPDRRGSGLNAPPRGHFESLQQCIDDTRFVLDFLLNVTGVEKAHLVGVSWGAKQAALLAQLDPQKVRSVTLIGPGLFPKIDLSTAEKFRVAMAMVNNRDRLFPIPLNSASFFTDNPERAAYVDQDNLKLLEVSASFLLASRRLDKHLRGFAESDYRGPMHLILAGRDKIIDNDKTRAWFDGLPGQDRQQTDYPDAHHTIEFESDPSEFLKATAAWLSSR